MNQLTVTKPILIALSGKSGAGKTTAADYLKHQHGFVILSFAEPIKKMAESVYNVAKFDTPGPDGKDRDLLICLGKWLRARTRSDEGDYILNEMSRKIDKMIKMGLGRIVVDDLRFECEAELLKKRGFVLVRIDEKSGASTCAAPTIERRGVLTSSDQGFRLDPSETQLDSYTGFDHVIVNAKTLAPVDQYREALDEIVVRIGLESQRIWPS